MHPEKRHIATPYSFDTAYTDMLCKGTNKVLCNYHTHTRFCDGEDTPDDMVRAALDKNFHSLGFAGHVPTYFPTAFSMSQENARLYREEIARLKAAYKGQIEIFMGVETDPVGPPVACAYDYVIGSVHFILHKGVFHNVDATRENFEHILDHYFLGDALHLVRNYYETLVTHVHTTHPDICGHFDLVTKFNSCEQYFDSQSRLYRDIALEAISEIARSGCIVEVNTGAMSRQYTQTPYPAPFLLKRLRELKCPVIISSDAHRADRLDFAFDDMAQLLCSLGFEERMEFRNGGFMPVAL